MPSKRTLIILLLTLSLCFSGSAFADTVILKSGDTIEGKIVERTDEYVKIDFMGVILTFYLNGIQEIRFSDVPSDIKTKGTSKKAPQPIILNQNNTTLNSSASELDRLLDEQELYVDKYERLLTAANSRSEFLPIIKQFEKEDTVWLEKYRQLIEKKGSRFTREEWSKISARMQKCNDRINAVVGSKPFKTCPNAK